MVEAFLKVIKKLFHWFKKAAEGGIAEAQSNLGKDVL